MNDKHTNDKNSLHQHRVRREKRKTFGLPNALLKQKEIRMTRCIQTLVPIRIVFLEYRTLSSKSILKYLLLKYVFGICVSNYGNLAQYYFGLLLFSSVAYGRYFGSDYPFLLLISQRYRTPGVSR